MKKAPKYKGGGAIKGEPKKPVKSTIDRTKYSEALGRPISGDGSNIVSEEQSSLNPDVITPMGYKYHSGTMQGKDIAYEKDGNIFLYNEQPDSKSNKYGLINIGKIGNAPSVKPITTAPIISAPKAKPVIDPNNKPLNLSNPNVTYDPNTGFYTNPVTGKMIEPIVEQYSKGGKVKSKVLKGYADDGLVLPEVESTTGDYNEARAAAQKKQANKQKAASAARVAGGAAMAIGNQMYQPADNYTLSEEQNAQSQGAKGAIDSTASSALPWYALAKGASNIGKSQIKRDEFGDAKSKSGKVADDWLTPDHELIMDGYQRSGLGGALVESSGIGKVSRSIGTLTGNSDNKDGFWGWTNKINGNTSKSDAKNKIITDAENAKNLAEAQRKAGIDSNRLKSAVMSRNEGDYSGSTMWGYNESDNIDTSVSNMVDDGGRRSFLSKRPNSFKDGGQIKGKGTGKSDSIKAKVEAGSFIVPAENAEIAEELREKVLRKAPNRKANLKQKGGEDIMVSNGEHSFTPEEKAELEAKGIDLFDLAPNSEHNPDKYGDGGKVKDKMVLSNDKIVQRAVDSNYEGLTDADKKRVESVSASKEFHKHLKNKKPDDVRIRYFPDPNSDKKLGYGSFAEGGKVGDKDFEKEELARIEAKRKQDAKRLGEAKAKSIAEEAKRKMAAEIRDGLQKQLNDKKKYDADVKKSEAEYNEMRKEYEDYVKNSDEELSRPASFKEQYVGASSRPSSEEVNKEKERMLQALNEKKSSLAEAKKNFDYANNEKNYLKDYLGGGAKATEAKKAPSRIKSFIPGADRFSEENITAAPTKEEVVQFEPSKSARKTNSVITQAEVMPSVQMNEIPVTEQSGNLYADRNQSEISRASQRNMAPEQTVTEEITTAVPETAVGGDGSGVGGKKGFDYNSVLSSAIDYGLPIAQTAIGMKKLKDLGKRPVDKIDPDYLNAIGDSRASLIQAQQNAKFGFTGDEKAALDQQNVNQTNAGRYAARNLSGGSSANMLNAERTIVNDSFGRKLNSKISDNALKMQKQQVAYDRQQNLNNMLQHKQELNRRLFGDTMNGWQQDQTSAGNLVNAGLSNLIDSNRYSKFKNMYDNAQPKQS